MGHAKDSSFETHIQIVYNQWVIGPKITILKVGSFADEALHKWLM